MIKVSTIRKAIMLLLCSIFCVLSFNLRAQKLQRHQTISAYLYNFAKHIQWPDEKSFSSFEIVSYTGNESINEELSKLSKEAKVKGVPIKFTPILKLSELPSACQLVFIGADKAGFYTELYDLIEGKPIILVSENYTDQRIMMLNIYDTEDKKMLFQVNKANVTAQNLSIDNDLMLLGGTALDVAQLYKDSQETLRSLQKQLDNSQKQLLSLNDKLEAIKLEIEEQNNLISTHEVSIAKYKSEETELKAKLEQQQKEMLQKQKELEIQKDSMLNQYSRLKALEAKQAEQNLLLDEGSKKLLKQKEEIEDLDKILSQKSEAIEKQSTTITRQRLGILWGGIIALLVIVLAIVIFRAYRANHKKNMILKSNEETIRKINAMLTGNNEKLEAANIELNTKNEELISTLDQLKDAQKQLIQAEKMASIGVLTAGIAHEMNNPINFIYAGVNSLEKDFNDIVPVLLEIKGLNSDSANLKETLIEINRLKKEFYFDDALEGIGQTILDIKLGAERTAEIVKGLRNFSRMEKEEWQVSDVHTVLDETLILLRNKYKQHIEINKKYSPDVPAIMCFPGKLNQVFMNLISNAIDAIQETGIIAINTKREKDEIIISISDNGKGIESENLEKIFDPFFTTKDVGKGVGLGLSISYGLIKEHNGVLSVASEPGQGTEFIIKLPVSQ